MNQVFIFIWAELFMEHIWRLDERQYGFSTEYHASIFENCGDERCYFLLTTCRKDHEHIVMADFEGI